MHPQLQNLSVFTWMDIIESNETCISLLGDLGLIPEKTDFAPACPKCSGSMTARSHKNYTLGWKWMCKKHKSKDNRCAGSKNPLDGTFFENNHIPLMDILGLMFGYFLKIGFNEIQDHINCWRRSRKQKQMSTTSISDFYSRFRKIILIALRKRGKYSENLEKTDVKKLFQKYSKTMEVGPSFRNLVFQFLMDVKSEYPCFGNKGVREYPGMSASTGSSSANTHIHVKNENDSNLPASTNVSLSSISLAAHRNGNMNVGGAKITSSAPVTTSASTTTTRSTVSENSRLPNCASASTAEGISSGTSANMDVQNTQTSNYNAVALASNCTNNSTVFLENSQILNNSTVASISVAASNNTTTTIKNAPISSINTATATIENVHTLIDNTDAIGIVQTSNNNSGTISSPSFSTDFINEILRESISADTVFFTDENMDIETEVIINNN